MGEECHFLPFDLLEYRLIASICFFPPEVLQWYFIHCCLYISSLKISYILCVCVRACVCVFLMYCLLLPPPPLFCVLKLEATDLSDTLQQADVLNEEYTMRLI